MIVVERLECRRGVLDLVRRDLTIVVLVESHDDRRTGRPHPLTTRTIPWARPPPWRRRWIVIRRAWRLCHRHRRPKNHCPKNQPAHYSQHVHQRVSI
jgi:hypothetical protein